MNSSSPTISGRSYLASDTIPEDSSQTELETSAHDSDTTPLASGVESSASELEQGGSKDISARLYKKGITGIGGSNMRDRGRGWQ